MAGRTIRIDPVTRIEGHGRVVISLAENGQVTDAYFQTAEFRGFEKFCEGRMLWDMPTITSRICGVCPVSHHLASVKACESLLGARPPRAAVMLRELLHMGQTIQSHALHFFFFGLPDFFKKELAPEQRSIFGLLDRNNSVATNAIKLRKVGQNIVDYVGGGRLHPVSCIPGGMSRHLEYAHRMELYEAVIAGIRLAQMGVGLVKELYGKNQDVFGRFAVFPSYYMGLVKDGDVLDLYDGTMRVVDAEGARVSDISLSDYLANLEERPDPRSWTKGVFLKGRGDVFHRVGPLARANVASSLSTPLANAELQELKALGGGKPLGGSLFYHYARLIELLHACERAKELLKDPEIMSEDVRVPVERRGGEGVGVIEAPRGTLIHHYWANEDGRITKANIVVATAHNKEAMDRSVKSVAEGIVRGGEVVENELGRIEMAVRCYDPCLSCSTHAFGRMPLEVVVQGPDGQERARHRYPRDGE
jgi:NAD-reducing hydrogenase large subunit